MKGFVLLGLSVLLIIVFIVLFAFLIKRLAELKAFARILLVILSIGTLAGGVLSGFSSYKELTKKTEAKDQLTKQLENSLNSVKEKTNNAENKDKQGSEGNSGENAVVEKQAISELDYSRSSVDELFNRFSEERQVELKSILKGSEKSRYFLMKNLGRVISTDNNRTIQLKSTSGKLIQLNDNQNKLVLFLDDTEFSKQLLQTINDYSPNERIIVVFPTLTGTAAESFISKQAIRGLSIEFITNDSYPELVNQSLKAIATQEYHAKDLPSFLAIDDKNVVSHAGAGSLISDTNSLREFLSKAFNSDQNQKLYKGIKQEQEGGNQ